MSELSIVVWDDVLGQADRVGNAVKAAWGQCDVDTIVTHHPVEEPNQDLVLREIHETGATLFICDIIRKELDIGGGQIEDPIGLDLIRSARAQFPTLAILAVTSGTAARGEMAVRVGACDWRSRDFFQGGSADQLFKLTERLLEAKGTRPYPYDESVLAAPNPEDLPLCAVVATTGALPIVYFASKLIGRCERIDAHFVVAGRSGASVLSLECTRTSTDGTPAPSKALLVKMAECETVIAREVRNRHGERHFEDCFVPHIDKPAIAFGGWFAVGSTFQRGATTLVDWLLCRQPLPSEVEISASFAHLFLGHRLAHTYGATKATGRPTWRGFSTILNLGRAARVLLAMKELSALTSAHLSETNYDPQLIRGFVRQPNRLGQTDTESGGALEQTCWSHGDLHGCNILHSQQTESLRLIDPGSIAVLHWAADPARLIVDLMVSAWGSGPGMHGWSETNSWLAIWDRVLSRQPIEDTGPSRSVGFAINWLVSHLSEYCSISTPERAWEFSALLGIEMLRSSYRNCELSTPKRVFALAAATSALRTAERQYLAQTA